MSESTTTSRTNRAPVRVLSGRAVRSCLTLICVAVLAPVMVGCQTANGPKPGEPVTLKVRNAWLRRHLDVQVTKSEVNSLSGLYEVDASMRTDEFKPGHKTSYRIVARTLFWEDSPENVVDESQWCELILERDKPIEYTCTSLKAADGYVIEVAYPKEAGIR